MKQFILKNFNKLFLLLNEVRVGKGENDALINNGSLLRNAAMAAHLARVSKGWASRP